MNFVQLKSAAPPKLKIAELTGSQFFQPAPSWRVILDETQLGGLCKVEALGVQSLVGRYLSRMAPLDETRCSLFPEHPHLCAIQCFQCGQF